MQLLPAENNRWHIVLSPLRKVNGQLQKLVSCKIELRKTGVNTAKLKKKANWATSSVLGNGSWFKISVNQNGVYRITAAELRNMGVPVDDIDPRTIKIYGHGGGLMPESNAISRDGDIPEVAIRVTGEGDGKMDNGDYVLFYGKLLINGYLIQLPKNTTTSITGIVMKHFILSLTAAPQVGVWGHCPTDKY